MTGSLLDLFSCFLGGVSEDEEELEEELELEAEELHFAGEATLFHFLPFCSVSSYFKQNI
jgi:hypothetical protein